MQLSRLIAGKMQLSLYPAGRVNFEWIFSMAQGEKKWKCDCDSLFAGTALGLTLPMFLDFLLRGVDCLGVTIRQQLFFEAYTRSGSD